METHSSVLDGKVPRTEEPGGLQSMGLQSWTRLSRHKVPTQSGEGLLTPDIWHLHDNPRHRPRG